MKILVLSDSHGDVENMRVIVGVERPDMIIHLGNDFSDAEELEAEYPEIRMEKVIGNLDKAAGSEKTVRYVDICGRRFLLTHGHTFEVAEHRDGIRNLFRYAAENGADIILYGHTHEPFLNCCNGKWIMNPGRAGRRIMGGSVHMTYGILYIDAENVEWSFKEVIR